MDRPIIAAVHPASNVVLRKRRLNCMQRPGESRQSPQSHIIEVSMDVQKTMEFIVEQQANFTPRMEAMQVQQQEMQLRQLVAEERHDREIGQIRTTLRSAIRLSIEEQRRERAKRNE